MVTEMFKARRGYTLIELILTISIVGLLGVIVAPRLLISLPYFNLQGEAKKMRAKIREIQGLSIAKRKIYRIEFSAGSGNYSVSYLDGETWVLVETIEPRGGIGIDSVTFAANQVEFNVFGAPDAGGNVVLINSKGQTVTLTVTPATGRVTIQ